MIQTYGEYCKVVDELKELAKAYYDGNEKVSDAVYDAKERELRAFEIANPDLVLEDSPTRKVYGAPTSGFRKVAHKTPMGSIKDARGIEEACAYVRKVKTQYGVQFVELEYKLDGASLALIYKDGVLVDAVTRGEDNVGDSVVENAVKIQGVKTTIKRKGDVEIRGETLWNFEDFEQFNEQLEAEGKKDLISNPRNGAAASLHLKCPDDVERRKLRFTAYIVAEGSESSTQIGDVEYLESEGFEVPPHVVVDISGDDGIEKFKEAAEKLRENRFNMPYPIDGVVVKVNDKTLHDEMGYTSKFPNFYSAYKFPPEEKDTVLLGIEESIGPSGAITPIAVFETISLAMTNVSRCSLHNWNLVEYFGLYKGCHVRIRKAGEIIPEIVMCVETGVSKDDYDLITATNGKVERYVDRVLSKRLVGNDKEFYLRPTECPFCHAPLRHAKNAKGEDLVDWVCDNPECTAQMVEKVKNFADRKVMNIRGFGEKMIQKLFDAGKIGTFDDIYRLTAQDLMDACGCREAKAKEHIANIEKSKGNYLHQWIEGFGISGIGHTASPVLAECINQCGGMKEFVGPEAINRLESLTFYAKKAGLTDTLIDKFGEFIKNQQVMLGNLVAAGIPFTVKESNIKSAKLKDRVCIMTGVFDKLGREEFKEMVVANGGKVCSGITKKTNLVLMGDNAGPAKKTAIEELQKAGFKIDVYTPDTLQEFLDLLA